MGNAKFFYFNYIMQEETEIALSSGGEDPFYPLSNLRHAHALKTYRSSGSATTVIVFDFQTAVTFDSFLAKGSSLGTLDLTAVTIEASATDEWTSPPFSATVTDFDYTENFASKFFTPQTYRYVRLTLTGTADYVEVGKLFLGSQVTLESNNIAIGFEDVNRDLSDVAVGRYGQRFVDRITDMQTFNASFSLLTKEEKDVIRSLYNFCGKHTPLWIILDPDEEISTNKDSLSGYFYFAERPGFRNDFYGLYSSEFELEEAK